jgi:predicted  nucleic acid-binding Zn-ribbon protein
VRSQIELLADVQVIDQSLRTKTLELAEGEGRVRRSKRRPAPDRRRHDRTRRDTASDGRQRDLEVKLGAAESQAEGPAYADHAHPQRQGARARQARVELLKDEASTLETELVGVMEQAETSGQARTARERSWPPHRRARSRVGRAAGEAWAAACEIERERASRNELCRPSRRTSAASYEMIFSRRGGLAVVEVRGGICQGCRMRVPPQLFNEIQRNLDRVFVCPSCQRILYFRIEAAQANG